MRRDIALGTSALLFVLITIMPLVIPHESFPPREQAASVEDLPPSEDVVAFFERNYAMQQAQTWFHLAGLAAFCVLAGRLAWLLRAHPRSAPWAGVAAISAAVMVAVMAVAMAWVSALLLRNGLMDGRQMLVLYDMGWDFHFKSNYFVPVFLGAVSWGALRATLLPRWLAWAGLIGAVLALLSTFGNLSKSIFFLQYPAFFILLLWGLAVAIVAFAGRVRTPVVDAAT